MSELDPVSHHCASAEAENTLLRRERDQLRAQLARAEKQIEEQINGSGDLVKENEKLRALLRAIVADSTCMLGEVIWPPGLALIAQARAALADLPEETKP